jgi:hypothetical protein
MERQGSETVYVVWLSVPNNVRLGREQLRLLGDPSW